MLRKVKRFGGIALWLVIAGATAGIVYFALSTAGVEGTNASNSPTSMSQRTIDSAGGQVIVSYRPGEVRLESLAPRPGFESEVKDEGPPEVRVEFRSADFNVEIRAEWDGRLVTEIDEDS